MCLEFSHLHFLCYAMLDGSIHPYVSTFIKHGQQNLLSLSLLTGVIPVTVNLSLKQRYMCSVVNFKLFFDKGGQIKLDRLPKDMPSYYYKIFHH